MTILPTTEQQRLSDWLAATLLTDTCAVQREVNSVYTTVSGMGAVPCMVTGEQYTGPMSDETAGADLKVILMPKGTDVRSPDRLIINSIKYKVFDVKEPRTVEILRKVIAARFPQRGGA
jgi:hypothetical protein